MSKLCKLKGGCLVKYISPKAEVVELELSSVILLSDLICIIFDSDNPGCEDKLPDFYE